MRLEKEKELEKPEVKIELAAHRKELGVGPC